MQSSSKWRGACCTAIIAAALSAQVAYAQAPIVISQLFGGANTSNPVTAPNGDFIEIFNRSCVAVNLDGYSVQVTSGSSGTGWQVIPLPNFQLDPGRYYCIRMTSIAAGTPFAHDLQQTTLTTGDLLLASNGKAAIVLGDTALTSGVACPAPANVVDLVRYDQTTAAACTEGNSEVVGNLLGSGRCVSRLPDVNADGVGDGCQDTNNNTNDFVVDSDPCVPRTNASPANVCPGAAIFGGCNLPNGSCIVTAGVVACSNLGGSYLGDCTACVAPQACCLPTTPVTCAVRSEIECLEEGGLYNPGQFACPPSPPCPPLGRCCSPDGSCNITFEALCVFPNTYGGNGTNCNGTPCQGRCCNEDGSCFVVGPDQCVAPSVFGGLGTNCDQFELCQGRCCSPDGTCTLTGSSNCLAPNTFGGVGTTCQNFHIYSDPNPPTVAIPTTGSGASASLPSIITVPDNFPIQDVNVRIKIQHTWRSDIIICLTGPGGGPTVRLTGGTSCILGGSCGSEDNYNVIYDDEGLALVCASANLADLNATPDNVIPSEFLGSFDGLPSVGDWTLNIFDDAGGDSGVLLEWALHLDDGNACQGACCFGSGTCQITGELPCQQQGGNFQGTGVSCSPSPCAPNGACCVGGTCSQQSSIDCGLNNGVFAGVGSSCINPPCFVPCCKPDGTCQLLTASACAAIQFATAGAPGSPCPPAPCAPVGACCFGDGSCQAPMTEPACIGMGGQRWRADQGCTPNGCQGRCCAPGGECSVTFPDQCIAPSVYGGDGTNCDDPFGCQGRCCTPDGSCFDTGPANCTAPNVFGGLGTNCNNPGACIGRCCAANGDCTETGPGNCAGQFGGLGTSCVGTYDLTQIALDFTDISATGTIVAGANQVDDGNSGAIPLGFTFNFFGAPKSQLFVNANGFVSFDAIVGLNYLNQTIPTAATPNNAVFGLWDDLFPPGISSSRITSQLVGVPGSQVFIVQWTGVPQYNNTSGNNTFQIKLFEGTERIEIHYQAIETTEIDTIAGGPGTSVGIENADGTVGVQYLTPEVLRTSLNGGGTALRFAPAATCTPVGSCTCRGDVNGDGSVNGRDVNLFAQCVASGGVGCDCADMNNSGSATSADIPAFVTAVITGNCGP